MASSLETKNDKSTQEDAQKVARHRENPFLDVASDATKTRSRKVTNASGDRLMFIAEETGEIVGTGAGFWHTEEVDKTQFIKLYVNGVKAFKDLTNPGTRVFELLYLEMQKAIGKDQVLLSYQSIDQAVHKISKATFHRGLSELVDKRFIAKTMAVGVYFVNPDYVWNGDRLAFVKDYRLKRTKEIKKVLTDTRTMPLPFEE